MSAFGAHKLPSEEYIDSCLILAQAGQLVLSHIGGVQHALVGQDRITDHRCDTGLGTVDIHRPQAIVADRLLLQLCSSQAGQAEGQVEGA